MLEKKYKITLNGLNQNQFLNACQKYGITLTNYIRFGRSKSEFFLTHYNYQKAKEQNLFQFYKLESRLVGGFAYYLLKIPQKIGLFSGILICSLIVLFTSQRLVKIEIETPSKSLNSQISELLTKNGCIIGSPWKNIDVKNIEDEIFANIEDASSVSVKKVGSTLKISSLIAAKSQLRTTAIVAPEDCQIEKLQVAKGSSAFKEGDIVKKGETIVSLSSGELAAEVKVRIFSQSSVAISQFSIKTAPTGKVQSKTKLIWPWQSENFEFNCNFEKYEKQISTTNCSNGLLIPIKKVTVTYCELGEIKQDIETAEKLAKEKAQALATKELKITDKITFLLRDQNGQKFVDCFAESVIEL